VDVELAALAPLADPVRRRLYLHVAASPDAVGREDAAAAVGVTRALAAFHLDRLVAAGLLRTEFQRRSGRTGPGAGRPAKLYRRAAEGHSVSLPARNYQLAATLFAEAIAEPNGEDVPTRVREEARAYGRATGEAIAAHRPATTAEELRAALVDEGYEPRSDGAVIRLGNCPFHALAQAHRDLTCGMNLALMTGLLEGLSTRGWRASLDPQPGTCCVAFEPDPAP
jgi:predicted ArsR family transcriptional regulator